MKILVLSLLRLGDLIMSAPAIRTLRDRYPDAKIDILINDSSAQGIGLIGGADDFHILPRIQLQSSLVDPESPIFQAPHDLLGIMTEIRNENYDLIINLTHNRLSGYLAGFFDSEKVLGLRLNAHSQTTLGSRWFGYLDRIAREPGRPVLHYADIFSHALGGQSSGPYLNHHGTSRRRSSLNQDPLVVIQCLTSDEKKNWSEDSWVRCLKAFKKRAPRARLTALASPSEADRLGSLQLKLKEKRVLLEVKVTNLKEALDHLMDADLIVTLDTAIKHLAMDATAPVIEICLGSSDPYRTGAYRDNAYIFRPTSLECSPCAHGEECRQSTRWCETHIDPLAVADWMYQLMGDIISASIGSSCGKKKGYELLRASHADFGLWRMIPLDDGPNLSWLKADLEVVSTFAELKNLGEGLIRGEGTLAYQWLLYLKQWFPKYSTQQWRHLLGELQQGQDELANEVAVARARFDKYLNEDKGAPLVHLGRLQDMRQKLLHLNKMSETKTKILQAADRLISEVSL